MLTSLDMEAVMSEVEGYCNGASHNRVRGQLPVQDLNTQEAEEKLVSWMAYLVSIKEVNSVNIC